MACSNNQAVPSSLQAAPPPTLSGLTLCMTCAPSGDDLQKPCFWLHSQSLSSVLHPKRKDRAPEKMKGPPLAIPGLGTGLLLGLEAQMHKTGFRSLRLDV